MMINDGMRACSQPHRPVAYHSGALLLTCLVGKTFQFSASSVVFQRKSSSVYQQLSGLRLKSDTISGGINRCMLRIECEHLNEIKYRWLKLKVQLVGLKLFLWFARRIWILEEGAYTSRLKTTKPSRRQNTILCAKSIKSQIVGSI